MSGNPMQLFEGINTREVSQQGVYLTEGLYTLKIVKTMVRGTQKSGDVFLVETEVVESSEPQKHPVGAKRTWIQGMRNKDIGQRAVLGFLFAVMGYDVKNEEDQKVIREKIQPNAQLLMSKACTENTFVGDLIKCEVTLKKNQQTGSPYHLHVFSPGPKAD